MSHHRAPGAAAPAPTSTSRRGRAGASTIRQAQQHLADKRAALASAERQGAPPAEVLPLCDAVIAQRLRVLALQDRHGRPVSRPEKIRSARDRLLLREAAVPKPAYDAATWAAHGPGDALPAASGHESATIAEHLINGWRIVILHGDLRTSARAARAAFDELLDRARGEVISVVIDLSRVTGIENTSLLALAELQAVVTYRGGRFRLVAEGAEVLATIRRAGLSGRFPIHRFIGDVVSGAGNLDEDGRPKHRRTR